MYLVLGTAALCVTALIGTVAVAATDGRGGVARWVRPSRGWASRPRAGDNAYRFEDPP